MIKEIHFDMNLDNLEIKKRGRPANKVWWSSKRIYFHRMYNVNAEQWKSINALCNQINEENRKKSLETAE